PPGPDIHGHHQSAQRYRDESVGRGADARRPGPYPQLDRASGLAKEPHGMNPPDATSQESTDKEPTAPQPPGPDPTTAPDVRQSDGSETAPDMSALGARERTGHTIRVSKLNAYYGTNRTVKDVTIDFPANEATALIGPSGSGKSTVVRCINRMH